MREISPLAISAFSFGEDDDWAAAGVTALGTLPLKVHVDTPTAVVNSWNSEKKVRMVLMSPDWCGVAVNTMPAGADAEAVFQACSLDKTGSNRCNKMTHKDEPGNKR